MPAPLAVAEEGPVLLNAVLVETEEATGRARSISRIDREYKTHG
jgi:calcineurin-like phosphoesterase